VKSIGRGSLAAAILVVFLLLGSLVVGMTRRSAEEGVARPADIEFAERRIQVEVLNATAIPRLAQRGTDRLRNQGFDVVHFGNASGYHADSSLVLDRVGDPEAAGAVARAIGVSRVRSEPDSTLFLAVTVILGTDWEGVEEATPAR
jgi:hypothetical protein